MYPHWSFGKEYMQLQQQRKNGLMGLAFEMVIASNPCISWNMADNSMATMLGVMAHAAFGHNHVFRNNYLFKKWSNSDTLAEYCEFARMTILEFEREFGVEKVERTLDAAHALQFPCGIFRHGEPPQFDAKVERARYAERMRTIEASFDSELLGTVPGLGERLSKQKELKLEEVQLPQENVLYFIEKYSPRLNPWQREVLRIVRNLAQMIYPQVQTPVLNEGAAMFVQSYLCEKLYQQGRISDGTKLALMAINQSVLYQPELRHTKVLSPRFNPYALGYSMCREIVRIAGPRGEDSEFFKGWIDINGPTDEDRRWFPSWAGSGDWRGVLKDAWANYRDESFITQFLSPRLIREWRIFAFQDEGDHYRVTDIHDEHGYEAIAQALGRAHSFDHHNPDVQVVDARLRDDRVLKVEYRMREGMRLSEDERDAVIEHMEYLWGYQVLVSTRDTL
jgi:stage V sporulation protein R